MSIFAIVNSQEQLIELFVKDPRTSAIVEAYRSEAKAKIQLTGLRGSQMALVLAGTFKVHPAAHLVVANDKEQAAYIQNTLSALLHPKPVWFFPDSFKRPEIFDSIALSNIQQRTEVVNQLGIAPKAGEIVVTYPEALLEKVVSPQALVKNKVEIIKEEESDIDLIAEQLLAYGFSREEFVYEPGQFSVRGGIIDIFSFGSEYPYRVELYDDKVESIRTFDPLSQLSVRSIGKVTIVPNVNNYHQHHDKISLLQALAPGTLLWVQDFHFFTKRIQDHDHKRRLYAEGMSMQERKENGSFFDDQSWLTPFELVQGMEAFSLLCYNDDEQPVAFSKKVRYESRLQPSFNKNFNLIIEHFQANTRGGITNFLFSESPRQIERLYAIFEDLGAKEQFYPIVGEFQEGFIDPVLKIAVFTDHQLFERFHAYKLRQGFSKDHALSLRLIRELQPGDFVTHIDHGVGRFSGLEKLEINGQAQESVRLLYKNNDILYVSINSLHKISKYVGKDGTEPKLNKLGSDAWQNLKQKTKKQVKDIAGELIKLYAKRKATSGFAFSPDNYLQTELEASFIYEDTPDQLKATIEVKQDMMKDYPMDRLICGDVGFGKTEIALRAAFKSVADGKQVALLVPTTILALQHYRTFSERLNEFNISVDYINRFRSTREKKEIYEKLKLGKLEIVIGTHALLNKEIAFKDLGLLIVDEEQKFGVAAKEKLRNLKVNVDTLTLTATPIPRTLQFSLMAARDLSILRTPPPNRQPIHTEIRSFHEQIIKDAVYYEVNRGGQVFFVHNRVKTLADMTSLLRKLCPDVDIASAHGQMEPELLEKTLVDYIDKKFDVLVCTNIIETGLDIPNANTIIINNAHQFGLSDLHQLRGRVGRSNAKAYCYLFTPPVSTLTQEARKRLRTIEEFSDLGVGFQIAMRDMDIRGAGNLLGAEQSGFITDIGYETYQKILNEAIRELKESDFKDVFKEELEKNPEFVGEVQIDTDCEMLIPDEYVSNIQERLNLYTILDELGNEVEIKKYQDQMVDRFGRLPKPVKELFDGLRLRWLCKSAGIERVILKNNKLRCYFVSNPQSAFYQSTFYEEFMQWVTQNGQSKGWNLKMSAQNLILAKDDVKGLKEARKQLEQVFRVKLLDMAEGENGTP